MSVAHPVSDTAVFICVGFNIVSVVAQVLCSQPLSKVWRPFKDTWACWSIVQALLYFLTVTLATIIWRQGSNASLVWLRFLLDACWLNSASGQSLMIHKLFETTAIAVFFQLASAMYVATNVCGIVMVQFPKTARQGTSMVIIGTSLYYQAGAFAAFWVYLGLYQNSAKAKFRSQSRCLMAFGAVLVLAFAAVLATCLALLEKLDTLLLVVGFEASFAHLALIALRIIRMVYVAPLEHLEV